MSSLEVLAARAAADLYFLARALVRWERTHGLSRAEACARLGLPESHWPHLALCPAAADPARLAAKFGCDVGVLREVVG